MTEAADVVAVLEPIIGQPARSEHLLPDACRESGDEFDDVGDGDSRGRLLALLGPTPVSPDDLARLTGLAVSRLHALLLELESCRSPYPTSRRTRLVTGRRRLRLLTSRIKPLARSGSTAWRVAGSHASLKRS